MGCDGGTIPRRHELVRSKTKPESKDKIAELAFRWKHCSIKQLPLQTPIVACGLGRLYSKESVLESLLDRSTLPECAEHIKSLKDVKTLNLTPNPAFTGEDAKNGGYVEDGKSAYICPVAGIEMNGKYKFCFIWGCGCVISERALKEIKSFTCHKCQKPFTDNDIVVLNAQDEDLKTMEDNILARKADRKNKKRSHTVTSSTQETASTSSASTTSTTSCVASSSSSNTNLVKEKVLDKEIKSEKQDLVKDEIPTKKVKKDKSEKIQVCKLKTNGEPQDPAYKKAKKDYSVAQDPRASEVLKSIFTTHKTAAEQTRAHWVTYNPFYN
ncbi:hypothetical protein QAD02_005342 [Eretmocerus hayati]|uniref:Uncharacterized protein n=1 Tax=Eretmocerus hayati TaxID=131215 RepID=A0ACC2NS41_9HYME|nr:hypothetical protein QAD02_005342 [Eretmocerus hayati]